MSIFKRKKLTESELNERDKKRRHYYPDIIGFAFAGIFFYSLKYWNVGNSFDFFQVLEDIAWVGLFSTGFGFIWRLLYKTNFPKPGKGYVTVTSFIIAICLTILIPTYLAYYINERPLDPCKDCHIDLGQGEGLEEDGGYSLITVSTDAIEIGNDYICRDCFAEGLLSGKYGFCEKCSQCKDADDMIDGYCENCFDYYVND